MRRLVEFDLPDGTTLLAEVDEPRPPGPRPAGSGDEAVRRAALGLDQALAKARPLAEMLLAQLRDLSRQPDQVDIEFGIKLNAAAGIVVASSAAEGNCKVTLSWKRPG